MFSVKALTSSDLPLMHGMLTMFGEAFGEPHTYRGAVPSDGYLARLLAKPHFIALVAITGVGDGDGEVIGGLAAYELEKFEQARSEIYIYDLAVRETHRRRGVAKALIRELKALAKERGAHVIFVQADHGDEPAVRLYQSLGSREDVHHFDIDVL